MKKKKGFIFIETLIVLAVLTVSLLATYSAYNSAISKENIRIHYDDPAYMYRTYYISQFLRDFNLNIASEYLEQNSNHLLYYVNCSGGDSNLLFMGREDNKNLCENLWNQFHISNIYITKENLQFLQNCKDFTGNCAILSQIYPEEAANYLRTIGGSGDGYRIIIEYREARDGTNCNPKCDQTQSLCVNNPEDKFCEYHYATLSLGDIT